MIKASPLIISLFLDNLQTHSWSFECASTTCAGFDVLLGLLIQQPRLPDVYKALAALLLGKKTSRGVEETVNDVPSSELSPRLHARSLASIMPHRQVCLDDFLQSLIDSQADGPAQQLCVEAAVILLELVKALVAQVIML